MKIKLKKEILESGGLSSAGSHQGFTKNIWNSLNNGEVVEVKNIPEKSKKNIEEVKAKLPKSSSSKKKEVKDGK